MFLLRSLCEDVISRLESHVSPRGNPPVPHQYNHPEALVRLGTCPLSHQHKHSHSHYLFFPFAPYWPNRSRAIFQPAAFFSKQLYLLGCGLFSLALSILCYLLSLSFGSEPYGTYDSVFCASIRKPVFCAWRRMWIKGGVILLFLTKCSRFIW